MTSLQSLYRLERDKLITVELPEYFFAYQVFENEFQVKEVYIKAECRGNSAKYFTEIEQFALLNFDIKYIVGYIWPQVDGSERSLVSLVKFGFKIYLTDNDKITLVKKVKD